MLLASQTDLENRYTADVLVQWTDDDDDEIADAAVVTAALTKASAYVERRLKPAYPDVIPFTSSVPEDVKEIVLSIAGYRLAGRKQSAAEQYLKEYEQAENDLRRLIKPARCLVFPDGTVTYSEGSVEAVNENTPWSSMEDNTAVFSDTSFSGF